jgi:hypothetical protein
MAIIWELDFYSRPIVDENQKKVWELLVCESPQLNSQCESLFRYAQFCPSDQVNSLWLRSALEEAISKVSHPPDKIRFFRQPMANMISKACTDLGIAAQASRRTFVLHQWLQDRLQNFYPTCEGYQPRSNPSVSLPQQQPQPLPDALVGQRWAFVNLQCQDFADMAEWQIDFGENFPLSMFRLTPDTPVPGVVIISSRSLPLAAWMSGLDLACLKIEAPPTPAVSHNPSRLILETGISDRWVLASFSDPQTLSESQSFEQAKQRANQIHFLAVQADPQIPTFAGFWLLQDLGL